MTVSCLSLQIVLFPFGTRDILQGVLCKPLHDVGQNFLKATRCVTGQKVYAGTKDYWTYKPLGKDENDRCVSMVNDTCAPQPGFAVLDNKQVVITGFARLRRCWCARETRIYEALGR